MKGLQLCGILATSRLAPRSDLLGAGLGKRLETCGLEGLEIPQSAGS